jgi:hypothetical protein
VAELVFAIPLAGEGGGYDNYTDKLKQAELRKTIEA